MAELCANLHEEYQSTEYQSTAIQTAANLGTIRIFVLLAYGRLHHTV